MQIFGSTVVCGAALAISILAGVAPATGGATARCTGDCNDDKAVRIAELILMVNIALDRSDVLACENGDADGNGTIEIHELIRAVGNALEGCRGDIEPPPFKTRIDHPFDPYLAFSATEGGPPWVKFTIRVSEPEKVYFQNSGQTPFHHDFVAATLTPYVGWTPSEIDAVSLYAQGQELVFGAVLYSPAAPYEIAIQLVRQDAYSVDEVVAYFTAVRAAVESAAEIPFFYFPTFEQQESATDNSEALAAAGVPLGSIARWLTGDVCYAMGWAHGRVVQVAPGDIDDAYAAGTLGPTDILLTEGVPAEIPFVAGVLTLVPSTPNSHVAILAADWQIPFAFLSQSESIAAAEALVGREVVLRATTLSPRFFSGVGGETAGCEIRLVDVTGLLDDEVAAHLRDLKRAPDLAIRPFAASGSYTSEVEAVTPDDIVFIGGKASGYGFLRRAVPANSRAAMAFTFDLWNDYLDQPIDGGATLRARIQDLLAPFPTYPPTDFTALFEALDEVRDLIDDVADFTPAQRTVILDALQRFDPARRIRFRSSTNVEDSDIFTGAGLYSSESGCLADDVDGDDEGPSRCDATRPGERGVFRALRKVFKSFYNDNAFLERLRHRVDETTVGMAVLVHYTFADETELGNGVATLRVSSPTSAALTIVSQPDAHSVTNPEDGGLPEVVDVFAFSSSVFPTLRQASERLPLGATVFQMPGEYLAWTNLFRAVGTAFGEFHGESRYDIEFEFKKITGEGLVLTQVRRIAAIAAGSDTPPVLIHTPVTLCTFQGEYADVFANYRLKSLWQPEFVSGTVAEETFYAAAQHRYVLDDAVHELSGAPSAWPDATHESFDPLYDGVLGVADSWTVGSGASRRVMRLETLVPTRIGPALIPIVFPDDLGFTLEADFDSSVPFLDFDGSVGLRREETVVLHACLDQRPLTGLHLMQERSFSRGAASVGTTFYWPPFPTGAVAGYTAPLDRWVATTIAGVVSEPIGLDGYFSQTYRPGHHNFTESFVFDPNLEEGVDPTILAEWRAKGIRAVVQPMGFDSPVLLALTTDGDLVDLADLLQ
jgi:hypothetical protein